MSIQHTVMYKGASPPAEVVERIKKAAESPIVFDEDCPEFTGEELEQMWRDTAEIKQKSLLATSC